MKKINFLTGFALALAVGCGGDSTAPNEIIPLRKLTLQALTPLTQKSIVGSVLQDRAVVRVIEENGKPRPKVWVSFSPTNGTISYTPGGGSVPIVRVMTDADGIAKLGGWRMANQPGQNFVMVSTDGAEPLSFSIDALVGPPSYITKAAGDVQYIPANSAAVIKPTVVVRDELNNPVPGIPVVFSVTSGGGTVTGGETVSDGSGIATVGSWVVGSAGPQVVSVVVAGLDGVPTFTATIANSARACGVPAALGMDAIVQGQLASESCRSEDGKYYDLITVNLSQTAAYVFKVVSPGFDTQLEVLADQLVARSTETVDNGTEVRAILPNGRYQLRISAATPGKLGTYSVEYRAVSTTAAGCEAHFVARGVSVQEVAGGPDCRSSQGNADRFTIYMKAGQQIHVTVEDLWYSFWHLTFPETYANLTVTRVPNQRWWILEYALTASADGFYSFDVGSPDDDAEYLLTIN